MSDSAVQIRASSLSELFDCPARWEAKYIHGKFIPKTPKSILGKALHASTAVYDQSVLDGINLKPDDAAGVAVDAIYKPDEDVNWEEEKPSDIEKIALSLHTKYCTTIAPKQNYKAVEVKCEALHISDLNITLTGTTDRIRYTEDGFSITDIKTSKTAVRSNGQVETKGHTYQLGVYEVIGQFASGLQITGPAQIVGLTTNKTENSQRIGVGEIVGARDVLLGDDETPGILHTAANIIHKGVFWGNPKSMMCHQNYCPIYQTCNYRK